MTYNRYLDDAVQLVFKDTICLLNLVQRTAMGNKPPVLRAALYRRAVACAWLTVCERQHRYPHLTLESLEAAIAAELEGFYLRQHGEEKGRQIACALLEDLMESGPLKAAPSLSFLGLVVMDELCARHIKAPVLH